MDFYSEYNKGRRDVGSRLPLLYSLQNGDTPKKGCVGKKWLAAAEEIFR